jgi:energy-coupling factor transporter ATP-binding protein EcfA2
MMWLKLLTSDILLTLVATGLMLGTTKLEPKQKAIAGTLAAIVGFVPLGKYISHLETSRAAKDTTDTANNIQGALVVQDAPVAHVPPKAKPLTQLVQDAKKYPHVMVIGKTGSGKSTICQALAALSGGRKFAIAPHFDPSKPDTEWRGCDGVFCGGRNYGTPEDEDISYDDIVNNRVPDISAFQILRAILAEMDRRYRDPRGFDAQEQHDWFLDETPAVARALDKTFGQLAAPLAYEARKVKLRLWIITQNDNVKALKLEGEGRVRDNFTYLYLGNKAKDRIRYLQKTGELKDIPEDSARLAVVDTEVAEVPDLDTLESWIDSNLPESRFYQFYQGEYTPPKLPRPLPKTPEDIEAHRETLEELLVYGLDRKMSETSIIKELWGYQGNMYPIGRQVWSQVAYSEEER